MISINLRDSRPIYEQVKDSFRGLIMSGVLPAESRLPSVRELASELTINPNTIQRAYRELEAEGVICSVPGKGSFVCDISDAAAVRKLQLFGELKEIVSELYALGVSAEDVFEALKGGSEYD